ncbi:hypothetical protein ACQUFY_23450 [Robbsia andropogonis]
MKKIICSTLLALGGMATVSAAFAAPPPHHLVCKRFIVHHHWVRRCR